MKRAERALIESALEHGAVGEFTDAEVRGLPDPVQAYLRSSIAPGTPLAQTARIRMRGRIKVGRWAPFRARQVLAPHHGFLWMARVAWLVSGSDHYVLGRGAMDWKLAGLISVAHGEGPDISRSAAGRAGAEAVWLPTALLPRFGVEWSADDATKVSARYRIDGHPVQIHLRLTDRGRISSAVLRRWGDPDDTGTSGYHAFGVDYTDYGSFGGLTIPVAGRAGWHHGSDRWEQGEFFRYRITDLTI